MKRRPTLHEECSELRAALLRLRDEMLRAARHDWHRAMRGLKWLTRRLRRRDR